MILSDRDIGEYIERGRLRIEPLFPDSVRENGLDLHFGTQFCALRDNNIPLDSRTMEGLGEYYSCVEADDEGYIILPGSHVLAVTAERVCLPDDLVGLVNLRSTFARLGLYIPPTVVDAGFCGELTIEIIGSTFPVRVYPGQRFLHLILVKTTSPVARPYSGKYQGQRGVTLPSPDSNEGGNLDCSILLDKVHAMYRDFVWELGNSVEARAKYCADGECETARILRCCGHRLYVELVVLLEGEKPRAGGAVVRDERGTIICDYDFGA